MQMLTHAKALTRRTFARRVLAAAAATMVGSQANARAAAHPPIFLLYVHERGCPFCRLWEQRIAPIYPRTREGQLAPLVAIDRRDPGLGGTGVAGSIHYTPTFVLIRDGREIGRIEGFAGDDFFWGQIERLVSRL